MKKTEITGFGHQIVYNEDMMHLAEQISENSNALAAFFNADCYLQSDASTYPHLSGGNIVCNAGAMIFKGEICLYDSQSVPNDLTGSYVYVWERVTTYRACDPLTYADNSSRSPHIIVLARLNRYLIADMPADSILTSSVLTPAQVIGNFLEPAGWTIMSSHYLNSWTDVAEGEGFQVRVSTFGHVEFRGQADGSSQTANTIAQLPSAYRPNKTKFFPVINFSDNSVHLLEIGTDGHIIVSGTPGALSFAGINYYL